MSSAMVGSDGEVKHKDEYDRHNPNKEDLKIQLGYDKPSTIGKRVWDSKMKGGFWQQWIEQPQAMSHASLEHDLKEAASNVAAEVVFISPERSKVNFADDVAVILRRISEVYKSLVVSHEVLPYHSHSLATGRPNVFAKMLFGKRKDNR